MSKVLIASLLLYAPPTPGGVPDAPSTPSPEQRIRDADRAWEAGSYESAAAGYAAAWHGLSDDAKTGPLGVLLLQKATDAYRSADPAGQSLSLLEAQRRILDAYAARCEDAGQPMDAALATEQQRIVSQHRTRMEESAEPAQPDSQDDPESNATPPGPQEVPTSDEPPEPQDIPSPPRPEVDSTAVDADTTDRTPREHRSPQLRVASIALLSGGAASAITGIAFLVSGALVGDRTEQRASDVLTSDDFLALSPTQQAQSRQDYAAWTEDADDVARIRYAVGGAALGVGVAALITGTVLLVRSRHAPSTRARLDRGPLGVTLRF